MPSEWKIETARIVNRHQFKTLSRRYRAEFASCFQNLGRVIDLLKTATPLSEIAFPFFRPEGDGVFRIGQTGVRSAREMRLYVTFVFIHETAYLLTLGTKETQSRDIADARRAARKLKEEIP